MRVGIRSRFVPPLLGAVVALAIAVPALAANSHANGHAAGQGNSTGAAGHGPTKIDFKLRPNQIPQSGDLTTTLTFTTHDKNHWVPLPGAEFIVRVDGADVGTGITDVNGQALLDYVGDTLGGHVMKVVFPGDGVHEKAQRAQGFLVYAAPAA